MKPNNIPLLKASNLDAIRCICHAFFTRAGGVSDGIYASLNVGIGSDDDPRNVHENRRRAMAMLKRPPASLNTTFQVHGANVVEVNKSFQQSHIHRADAMVSQLPGAVLGILTADCVPVLFADPIARVVGAAHSGWKGTLIGILPATIDAMEQLGASRKNTHAAIGPAIGQSSYEVGPEFPCRFLDRNPGSSRFFKPSNRRGHHLFNLTGCARDQLESLHLASINHLDFNTFIDERRFFSYRRSVHRGESDYGRNLSAICLTE